MYIPIPASTYVSYFDAKITASTSQKTFTCLNLSVTIPTLNTEYQECSRVRPTTSTNSNLALFNNSFSNGDCFYVKDFQSFDLVVLMQHCPNIIDGISSKGVFDTLIYSESKNKLGYIPYSESPTPVVVRDGFLHYALTKEVRDYAARKGKLDVLNEYCCNNKEEIALFNADKTRVDTL